MALTQRQMACFTSNPQFLNEVAGALLPIAAGLKRGAMVTLNSPDADQVARAFAEAQTRIAEQILSEQGITLTTQTGFVMPTTAVASGSTAMKYLVQQLLLSPDWTLTPDEWAANEMTARLTIQVAMAALISGLVTAPTEG